CTSLSLKSGAGESMSEKAEKFLAQWQFEHVKIVGRSDRVYEAGRLALRCLEGASSLVRSLAAKRPPALPRSTRKPALVRRRRARRSRRSVLRQTKARGSDEGRHVASPK